MKDGGPAFPVPVSEEILPIAIGGMSLRDWFAGMAMNALISDAGTNLRIMAKFVDSSFPMSDAVALQAFHIADAMITEREKREKA